MSSIQENTEVKDEASKGKTEGAESPAPESDNPYHYPEFGLPTGLFHKGNPVGRWPVKDDGITHLKKVEKFHMREDDILLIAYPKCGTHWTGEIVHMLTTGSTEFCGHTREHASFEYCGELSNLESLASPRVLNTHFVPDHLPREVLEKKIKLIHVLRNPKDCAVSFYHHMKFEATEKFTFDNFITGYPSGKYLYWSHQIDYIRKISEFEKAHPDHPIMHVHYEDIKENPVVMIKELAKFLGIEASDEFCQKVAIAVGFANMKTGVKHREFPKHIEAEKDVVIYRKGIVGDWKNIFTVAQSEMFDEFLAAQKENDFGFTFRG